MHARLTAADQASSREWLIVTRWGIEGEYLSLARTCVPARGGTAPIQLRPKQTALAVLQRSSPTETSSIFLFCRRPPMPVSVAGIFMPTEGKLRLHGYGATLRLSANGLGIGLMSNTAFRMRAVRASWFGEYIEGETK
jgi:hypothetical protein